MGWIGLLALLVVAVLGLSIARRRSTAAAPAPRPPARFGAVEIRVRGGACDAAGRLAGRRFLAKEAPALPLAGCTAERCACKFVKLSDRRSDDRRLEHGNLHASAFLTKERRSRGDRRDAD